MYANNVSATHSYDTGHVRTNSFDLGMHLANNSDINKQRPFFMRCAHSWVFLVSLRSPYKKGALLRCCSVLRVLGLALALAAGLLFSDLDSHVPHAHRLKQGWLCVDTTISFWHFTYHNMLWFALALSLHQVFNVYRCDTHEHSPMLHCTYSQRYSMYNYECNSITCFTALCHHHWIIVRSSHAHL